MTSQQPRLDSLEECFHIHTAFAGYFGVQIFLRSCLIIVSLWHCQTPGPNFSLLCIRFWVWTWRQDLDHVTNWYRVNNRLSFERASSSPKWLTFWYIQWDNNQYGIDAVVQFRPKESSEPSDIFTLHNAICFTPCRQIRGGSSRMNQRLRISRIRSTIDIREFDLRMSFRFRRDFWNDSKLVYDFAFNN